MPNQLPPRPKEIILSIPLAFSFAFICYPFVNVSETYHYEEPPKRVIRVETIEEPIKSAEITPPKNPKILHKVKPEYRSLVQRFGEATGIGVELAVGILLTENRSQNPHAINYNVDGSADHGMWQLNGIPEYDPVKNTEKAIELFNNKKTHLAAFGYPNPDVGLLIRSYNMGAAGAIHGDNGYDDVVFVNAGM